MTLIAQARATTGICTAIAAAVVSIPVLAAPALAGPTETDRPKVTRTHHDFGENWTLGAPRNGGHLEWELVGGVTSVELTGYHYLTDQECGRVRVEYYNAGHGLIGTDDSGLHCAPGNGKTQWFVNETFSSTTVEHVHVELEDGSRTLIGSDTEDFD
jgi:hypothetical protein